MSNSALFGEGGHSREKEENVEMGQWEREGQVEERVGLVERGWMQPSKERLSRHLGKCISTYQLCIMVTSKRGLNHPGNGRLGREKLNPRKQSWETSNGNEKKCLAVACFYWVRFYYNLLLSSI